MEGGREGGIEREGGIWRKGGRQGRRERGRDRQVDGETERTQENPADCTDIILPIS
jgi:hypothetical protein